MKNFVLFRFIPTMGCNYRCSYCFVPNEEKKNPETMFDQYSPTEWIDAMALWKDFDVEFYMWGGEPFSIKGTYEVVKGWTDYEHIVSGSRIDTNMFYVDRILERCPTSKVKLNCSWHREYESLEDFFSKIKRLKEKDMVGMCNFVANNANIRFLKEKHRMTLDDLVTMFEGIGVFMNIAADFSIFMGHNFFNKRRYRKIISRFTCPEDWEQLRDDKDPCQCQAPSHFFTVHHNGDITSCLGSEVIGNFFQGTLEMKENVLCSKKCPSLIAYPFRLDNDMSFQNSLLEYVERNSIHRKKVKKR